MTLDKFRNEEGAIALEYILVILFVALLIIAGGVFFANAVSGKFKDTGAAVTSAPVTPLKTTT